MDSLQVRTGQISLRILDDNGDERGVFKFNPKDVEVAKKVFDLQEELQRKQVELDTRAEQCETDEDKISLLSEAVQYFRGIVDNCFGAGSSDILFGDANTLSMFADFFEGIIPYYAKASEDRIKKYSKPKK